MADAQLRRLARQLVGVDNRLKSLERVPQLDNSSLDNKGLKVYDEDGNLTVTLGKQSDGSFAARPIRGPIPPKPIGVSAEGDAGLVHALWQGMFYKDAPMPRDFEAVEVLVDGNVQGAIHDPEGGSAAVPAYAGEWVISFRTVSQAGVRSEDSGHTTVTVESKASVQLDEARGRIEDAEQSLGEAQERLDEAEQTVAIVTEDLTHIETVVIPGAVADLEAADQAAQDQFAELDNRLGDFATDESLGPIREALAEAQDAVDAAKSIAETANQAANAASQAALEAAGIAASKGRVIIQETEPVGEDRNAANIWIKPIPDDPDTEVEEKSVTYVYFEASDSWEPTTSSELAQAAQNALDAREAAQQATQRAETAISNAAAAQSAAQAAQRTADEATLDAREAHNEAVAAQETASAIRDDMASGPSLWADPSFERGMGPLPGPYSGRIELSSDWAASGSQSVKYIANGSGGNNYGSYVFGDLTPGHWYAVSATVHAGEHEQKWNTTWDARTAPTQSADNLGYVIAGDDGVIIVGPGETISRTWFFQAPEGGVAYRFWAGQASTHNKAEHEGQVVYLDDFRMVDVTESYPQYLAAQQAAQAAQARADEAYAEAESKLDESQVDAKITASANGKNSITRSTSAASGKGVVVGDLWVQVDSAGDAFRQWYWDGSAWKPAQIKSDMLEALDVHKLQVTGEAKMDSAVIDKLFAETFAAHKITASELIVSSPQNLIPGVAPGSNRGMSEFEWDETENALRADGRQSVYADEVLTLVPGEYVVEADIKASVAGTRTYVGLLGGSDVPYNFRYGISNVEVGTEWQTFSDTLTILEGEGGTAKARFLPAYSGDETATTWYRNVSIRPMVGTTLIGPGAVTTEKITFTEELSGEVANFMSTESKKLVVTEEAILNHATLIGQTVVDDINVQGKLIGTDGVFTGTVDFTNVNVTGEQVVNKLAANSIEADKIKGGSFAGNTFTGGVFKGGEFQAPADPRWNGGVAIDPKNGIRGWNTSGEQTFGINGTSNFFSGTISTGREGRPSAILTPVTGSGGRVGGGVWFSTDGSTGRDQAAIYSYLDGNIHIRPKDTLPKGTVFIDGNLMVGDKTTFSSTLSAESITSFGTIATMKPGRGTSSTANTIIESGTGLIRMTASSRRYKQEIEDWSPSAEDVLKLRPRSWKERKGLRPDMPDYQDPNRYVGFIAEEVADAGLEELVVFADDEEGNYGPDNLNYDRIPAAQQVVLQDHEARILELEGENRDLRSRLAAIEERLIGDNHV